VVKNRTNMRRRKVGRGNEKEVGMRNAEVGSRNAEVGIWKWEGGMRKGNAEIGKDKIRQFANTVRLKTADALPLGCYGDRR
jgi:hypothetical protein